MMVIFFADNLHAVYTEIVMFITTRKSCHTLVSQTCSQSMKRNRDVTLNGMLGTASPFSLVCVFSPTKSSRGLPL
jgi:hypothetical protein